MLLVFKCGKKFKAQIQVHGVQTYLGMFDDELEAAKAYDAHARVSETCLVNSKVKLFISDYIGSSSKDQFPTGCFGKVNNKVRPSSANRGEHISIRFNH